MRGRDIRTYDLGYLFLFIIAIFSCQEDSPSESVVPATGTIVISVLTDEGKVIPNASVSTEPSTQGLLTDSAGVAIIENVEAGNYLVRAESQGTIGSGSSEVLSGVISNVTIRLMSSQEADAENKGVLFLQVYRGFGIPVNGAIVETNPETSPIRTNALGSAIIRDLDEGIYVIEVYQPEFGSANGVVEITANESSNLTLQLVQGVFLNPQVQILDPIDGQQLDVNGDFKLRGKVTDNENLNDIQVTWSRANGEVISTGGVDEDGIVEVEVVSLGFGEHSVFLEAINAEGRRGIDSVSFEFVDLPDPVIINEATATTRGNRLGWSAYEEGDFYGYYIYRLGNLDTYEVIDSVLDQSINSYMDRNVIFGTEFTYRVGIRDTSALENFSSEKSITAGLPIEINGIVSKMVYNSDISKLLVLDNANFELLVIDPNSQSIENRVNTAGKPTDLDINPENGHIYVSRASSNGIMVFDPETLSVTDTVFIPDVSGGIEQIAILSNNFYAVVDEFNGLHTALFGESEITTSFINSRVQRLLITPDRQRLIVSRSFFDVSLIVYNVLDGELTRSHEGGTDSNRIFNGLVVTGDGNEIVFGGIKTFTNNININLGSFNDAIYAINQDGSVAMGTNGAYDGNTFLQIRRTPVVSEVMAIDLSSETFYLYGNLSSRIYAYNVN